MKRRGKSMSMRQRSSGSLSGFQDPDHLPGIDLPDHRSQAGGLYIVFGDHDGHPVIDEAKDIEALLLTRYTLGLNGFNHSYPVTRVDCFITDIKHNFRP